MSNEVGSMRSHGVGLLVCHTGLNDDRVVKRVTTIYNWHAHIRRGHDKSTIFEMVNAKVIEMQEL